MSMQIEENPLVRNTILNFVGQCLPLVIGLLCVPSIVNNLGPERFGLLSLAWIVIGTLSIFDLGMGRATTRYVAEALGKGDVTSVPRLVWAIVWLQVILGLIGACLGLFLVRAFGESLLKVSLQLMPEAVATFEVLALGLPVVLLTNTLSGALQAAQRFDITNAVKVPSASANFVLPLVGSLFGLNLPWIVTLLICGKFVALTALLLCALRTFPGLSNVRADLAVLPSILSFGGWITVSNLISPILANLDRYILAVLLPVAAVGYYTVPAQAITYLSIIPASLTTALFPAYSRLEGMGRFEQVQAYFARSVKYTLLVVAPLAIVVSAFAGDLLTVWIGQDFAQQSTTALQILALGVLVNAVAYSPYTLLQALGRPDVPAKFHLVELPLYAVIAWVCVEKWGIAGAALAWSVRVTLDAILLFMGVFSVFQITPRFLSTHRLGACALLVFSLASSAYVLNVITRGSPVMTQAIIFSILVMVFGFLVWVRALDNTDRDLIWKIGRAFEGHENTANH